jgi:hypothetical protein
MKIVHPSRPARQRRELTPDAARTAMVRLVLGMGDAEVVYLHSRWTIVANRGPASDARREPAGVIAISGEDSLSSVTIPRLKAAGADTSRIDFLSGIRNARTGRPCRFIIEEHAGILRDRIKARGDVALVIVDPLGAHTKSGLSGYGRGYPALSVLSDIATEHDLAVLALHHETKGGNARAMLSTLGTVAVSGCARAMFAVGEDPDGDGKEARAFACAKMSIAPMPPGIGFEIVTSRNKAARVVWGDVRPGLVADDFARGRNRSGRTPSGESQCASLVADLVAAGDGWAFAADAIKQLGQAGYGERMARRAMERAGLTSSRVSYPKAGGMAAAWVWHRPGQTPSPDKLAGRAARGQGDKRTKRA